MSGCTPFIWWSRPRRAACRCGPAARTTLPARCCARPAGCAGYTAWTPCSRPILITTSPRRRASSSTFWPWRKSVAPLPVTLYNVPGRTAVNLEPETVLRLAEAAPNIQAIKEASGKLPQIAELVHILPRGFKIFSGDDNMALAAIGVGAHGLISVASNEIPAEISRMIRAALNNNWAEARALERRYAQLFDANFWESNPRPVKTVLNLMGRCRTTFACRWCRPQRPPAPSLNDWPANLGCSVPRLRTIDQESRATQHALRAGRFRIYRSRCPDENYSIFHSGTRD